MKKSLSSNQWIGTIFLFLSIAMMCIVILFIKSNTDLQGNARIINYTGIIRGGTQKLIKQELMRVPNDALIADLDSHLRTHSW